MKAGKLPQDLLAALLERLPDDPRVLLGPGIGRDAAAIDAGDGRVLVAKADPVTFATDQIGRYAVQVNANDVACLGAKPTWFMATVFLPEDASEQMAKEIFEQILSTCQELGIVLIGGHTEITIGLDRPIISGAMLGDTTQEQLIRPDGAQAGDHVLLTAGIAIEGTAILAREAPHALRAAGVGEEIIERAAGLLLEPGISVVSAARTACATGHVRALHDPTEGGLVTGLCELATASDKGLRVYGERVPIFPETGALCEPFGIDPLRLIASGALWIATPPSDVDPIMAALRAKDIPVSSIAEVRPSSHGITLDARGQEQELVPAERDEIAKVFDPSN